MRNIKVLVASVTLVAACSAPGNDELATSPETLSTPFANDKPAYDFFVGKGLTNFQAAGVVGNLDQESGVNPTISQTGGGPGRGIAQWSAGARWDTTPGDNLVAYAAMQGMPTSSLTVQLGFMWYELEMFPAYGLAQLRASTNITDATTVIEDDFEGCVYANFPVCNLPQRVTYAKNVLAAYGSDPVPPRDGGATTNDGAATSDVKAMGDGATTSDVRAAGDGAATGDVRVIEDGGSPDAEVTPDAGAVANDAGTRDAVAEAAPPIPTEDTGAPNKTPDAASTSDAGKPGSSSPNDESSGCAVATGGSGKTGRGYWFAAIGLALASVRRRRRKV